MQYKRLIVLGGGCLVFLIVALALTPSSDANTSPDAPVPPLTLRSTGAKDTTEFALHFQHKGTGESLSPWHDLPLKAQGRSFGEYTFVCEIPKGTTPKMEINKETPFNPIIQDTKKGVLRNYPWPSLVNYGAFPQTWEDPSHVEPDAKLAGDNDPLDVLEIGTAVHSMGEVYQVKVLGALALVDGDEMDWKIITVATDDPLAALVDDVANADAPLLAKLEEIKVWFRDYKKPDGKPENSFAYEGRFLSRARAIEVVESQHLLWAGLVRRPHTLTDELWWRQREF